MTAYAASERDPRVQQMIDDPTKYFARARREAQEAAERATKREEELRRRLRRQGKRK